MVLSGLDSAEIVATAAAAATQRQLETARGSEFRAKRARSPAAPGVGRLLFTMPAAWRSRARCRSIAATDSRAWSSPVPDGKSNTSEGSNGLVNRTGDSCSANGAVPGGTVIVILELRYTTTPNATPRATLKPDDASANDHLRKRAP